MQEKKLETSGVKVGMIRDRSPYQLDSGEYVFCLNHNTSTETGDELNLVTEPSSILSTRFPDGFKVWSYRDDPNSNRVYFILTNPTTRLSSIGFVVKDQSFDISVDSYTDCPDCTKYRLLSEALEDITEIPFQPYVELLNDFCHGELNLSLDFPAKFNEIKTEKTGTVWYWVDDNNPDRYINLSNIDYYQYTGEIICGVDNTTPTCIDVEKLLQFPNYTIPHIEPERIEIGGNLKQGSYSFTIAYTDQNGNEISTYSTPTNPLSIFDEGNNIETQPELNKLTNFGIRLKVTDLDQTFKYYKVVVIERVNLANIESSFIEGIHPTTDDSILYTSSSTVSQNNVTGDIVGARPRINLETILAVKARYEKTGILAQANSYLFHGKLTEKREVNLQPVVNLMGAFTRWHSAVAKEDLYKSQLASSKYKGYMRDEVQPFAIKFEYSDGHKTAAFPLISRPPIETTINGNTVLETDEVEEDDYNYLSIDNTAPQCGINPRTKYWQLYNTATVEGTCPNYVDNGTIIEQPVERSCTITPVYTIPAGSFVNLPVDGAYSNLQTYLEDNLQDILTPGNPKYLSVIADAINDPYPDDHCTPQFQGTCDTPVLTDAFNEIGEVVDSEPVFTEKVTAEYDKSIFPDTCYPYIIEDDGDNPNVGNPRIDLGFLLFYMDCLKIAFQRDPLPNELCGYAPTVVNNNDRLTAGQPFYNNYVGAFTTANLQNQNNKDSVAATHFLPGLHDGALWFKINRDGRDKLVFEVTKNSACQYPDDIEVYKEMRYTFYSDCNATVPISTTNPDFISGVYNTDAGLILIMDDLTDFPTTDFYVALDPPYVTESVPQTRVLDEDTGEYDCSDPLTRYRTAPPCGCYSVYTRDIEYSTVTVDYDSIEIIKKETYTSNCEFILPKVNDCDPQPFEFGKPSYWESEETYPDNAELYDSSTLVISPEDLGDFSNEFEDYFTNGVDEDGNYTWRLREDDTPETNFQCKAIRHFKFPDNTISPFINTQNIAPFSDSLIFPIGIKLDNEVVNLFLDIAVTNNLITQKERESIVGYEILKADNSVNKSVVTNALGYDMYKYVEGFNNVYYPNYPHNDLGQDYLHLNAQGTSFIQHPHAGAYNSKFSLISPEFAFTRPLLPTEVKLSGFQVGNSRGQFNDVENHPKWVILTAKARDFATTLAVAEFTLEKAIQIADFTTQSGIGHAFLEVGFVEGTNTIGTVASIVALAVLAAASVAGAATKIGTYRYQWLETFKNLGQVQNFASYFASEGYHNRFIKNEEGLNKLRAISTKKYMRDGKYTFSDSNTGSRISVNNFSREYSTFISLGDPNEAAPDWQSQAFEYPDEYKNYDNNLIGQGIGSRFTASMAGCPSGASIEIPRNVGSPYFTLKNYLPTQFGNIDSIQWLTTNYRTKLTDDNTCDIVYGGTVYISRFTWKRKLQIYRTTAYGLADRTAFNYSDYPNIARPYFFIDYDKGSTRGGIGGAVFPEILTTYNMDCETKQQFYVTKPSKIYLYYYGIANYLVESEINCNFRYGKPDPKDQFYPQAGDLLEWTKEKNVSIREPNSFFYNNVYSTGVTRFPYKILDKNYSFELYEKLRKDPNGVAYSEQDKNEGSLTDPYLIYKPFNKHTFPKKYGRLIDIRDISSEQLLFRFELQQVIINAIDNLANDKSPRILEQGNAGIFAGRALELPIGTQNSDAVETPYGLVTADARKGMVYIQNGRDYETISDVIGGKPSGMKNWFREHLPFKILRSFPDLNVDNKFKGLGLSFGYDSRFGRIFITKKDWMLNPSSDPSDFEVIDGLLYKDDEIVDMNNNEEFIDVSFTVAYKIGEGWISYYSFAPNYYVSLDNYFQSGYNYYHNSYAETLNSHLLTNKSFGVFCGEKFPSIVEAPIKNEYVGKVLETIKLNVEAKRYQNAYDYAVNKDIGFTAATIYNSTNNSGYLSLNLQRMTSDNKNYPKNNQARSIQDILYTSYQGQHTFNYFYNRVVNQNNNVEHWNWDRNFINKTLNPNAVNFYSKGNLERLRGQYFILRLINDANSQYEVTLKNTVQTIKLDS